MTVVAIIPARYASTRFPGKPLALIGMKPMIQHVYESASMAPGLDRVLVATDDRRIFAAVTRFGGEAILTSRGHASGTDRLAEAARKLKAEWVINVQGDLPFVRPDTIARILRPLRRDPTIPMATARTPIRDPADRSNPNVVKVVIDNLGFALYFSRAAIPYQRDQALSGNRERSAASDPAQRGWGYRHVGVYGYRREFLMKFARLRPTSLERIEGLEQLRALAHGYRIRVADVEESSVEVNTPEDLAKAADYLKQLGG